MVKLGVPWELGVSPRYGAMIGLIRVWGRLVELNIGLEHFDYSIDGQLTAVISEGVLEFNGDRVLILGKGELVSGRVVRIWITKVGLVSSGT